MIVARNRDKSHPHLLVRFNSGVIIWVDSPVGVMIHIRYKKGNVRVEGIGVTRKEAFRDLRLRLKLRTDEKFRETHNRLADIPDHNWERDEYDEF